MTKSEIIIAESKVIVCSVSETHPALAQWISRITTEYEQAIKDVIRLEKTIHMMGK